MRVAQAMQTAALACNIHRSNSDNDFTQYLSNMNNMDSMYINGACNWKANLTVGE